MAALDRIVRKFTAFKYQPKESKQAKVDRLMRLLRDRTGIGRAAAEDMADALIRKRDMDALALQKNWPLKDGTVEGPKGSMTLKELEDSL